MKPSRIARCLLSVLGSMAVVTSLAACSVGSISGGEEEGVTTISFVHSNDADSVEYANVLIEAFEKENPDIKVKLDTIPTGSDGDNVVKTRLSTGDMADVFAYNSGSLFQAIRPDEYLVPLSEEGWVKDVSKSYLPAVSTDQGLYGAPNGGSTPGGVIYNKVIYKKLGLTVPQTWSEFQENNKKILKSGLAAPVEQTFGDPWTAQVVILSDFANIAALDPEWADKYTANKARNAESPALSSWTHLQELHDQKLLNKDFASATYDDGVKAIATGKAAHYPMLAGVISAVEQNYPDNIDDVGMFAMPTEGTTESQLTLFLPGGFFIPKSTTDEKLVAAKKFVAFTQSAAGCDVLVKTGSSGPFVNSLCTVPDDSPVANKEMQAYVDKGSSGPGLEFVSPVKGPNLPQLAVEVGSGIRSAKSGAKLYDQDVKKQAEQLGLEGW